VAGGDVATKMGGMGTLPGNVSSIAIPFFENSTRTPNIEGVITTAVVDEFMSSVQVVDVEDAEAVLFGTIEKYKLKPVSFTSSDVVQEYRLYLTISLFMVRRSDDKVLWQENDIVDYEDFVVDVNDVSTSEDAEWSALNVIAFDMARSIKERLIEGY
jgi:outer membrane lipopolysaccharide assembly protein LptE/RlpB